MAAILLPSGDHADPAKEEIPETVWSPLTCGDLSLFRAVRVGNHQCAFSLSRRALRSSHRALLRTKAICLPSGEKPIGTAYVFDHFSGIAAQDRHPVQHTVLNGRAPVGVIKKIAVG